MNDGFRRRAIHSGDSGEFIDRSRLNLVQCSEVCPETLPPLRSNTDDVVEHGDEVALAAQLAMKCDCKAVRLVTDALNEIEGRTAARELDRLGV